MSSGSLASDSLNACAVPCEVGVHAGGRPISRLRRLDGVDRVAERRRLGAVLNEMRDRRELPLVVDGERRGVVVDVHERAERHRRRPSRCARRCWSSASRVLLVLGLHLEDDAVEVELREDRRHLPLAERVVERVVDRLRRDAQARGGVAVDGRATSAGRAVC